MSPLTVVPLDTNVLIEIKNYPILELIPIINISSLIPFPKS